MPEISRQLRVTFSKAEIKDILSEHAKAMVFTSGRTPAGQAGGSPTGACCRCGRPAW